MSAELTICLHLEFDDARLGRAQRVWGIRRLAFLGGASTSVGVLGDVGGLALLKRPARERFELLARIHEFISGKLAAGGTPKTAHAHIATIGQLFAWAEKEGRAASIESIESIYLAYAEHIYFRISIEKSLSSVTGYGYLRLSGQVLDAVLERRTPIIEATRVRRPSGAKEALSPKAESRLQDSLSLFGEFLLDVCDYLSVSTVFGPRPIKLTTRRNVTIELSPWKKAMPEEQREAYNIAASKALSASYEADKSLDHQTRKNLVNLRVTAEFLTFIAQTGFNVSQASSLSITSYSYSSIIDGYAVRDYKARRGGEVLFEIFSEYKSHFDRYLVWRREIFGGSEQRLFPFVRRTKEAQDRAPHFLLIQKVCRQAGVRWFTPRDLRASRINWFLRRTGDPQFVADMAQHDPQTLLKVYERPSLQRAISEVGRFYRFGDPELVGGERVAAIAPGECNGIPLAVTDQPARTAMADCIQPSGCLWCEHHRDIDTLDYVWSLACFRHLKVLELSKVIPPPFEHPAKQAAAAIGERLAWFQSSNPTRRQWVHEAENRVEEGDYHPDWELLLHKMENAS